jgi:serine protease Do
MIAWRWLLLAALLLAHAHAWAAPPSWGWLGVRIRDLSEAEMEDLSLRYGLREGYGVLIVEVLSETPAAQAGIRNGDLIVAVKGRPIVETRALQRQVGASPIGEELTLTLFRNGRRQAVKARVGQMPRDVLAERVAAEFGFGLTGQNSDEIALTSRETLLISAVVPGSPAERAGVRAGDQLIEVNDSLELTRQTLHERLASHDLNLPLRLVVRRDGQTLSLQLAPSTEKTAR